MKLELTPPKGVELEDFINNYLIFQIPTVYKDSVDVNRLSRFDDYLNDMNISTKTKTGKKRKISTYDVLYSAFNNLTLAVDDGIYTLTINPNTMVANFNLKVLTVAELVNYGTVSVRPYPIIDIVFDKVADRMDKYFSKYMESINEEKHGN